MQKNFLSKMLILLELSAGYSFQMSYGAACGEARFVSRKFCAWGWRCFDLLPLCARGA
jgi:hypothetical protein